MPAQAQLATKPSLTLKRRLNAAPEKVFAAWTDPKKIVKWFGPDAGGWGAALIASTASLRPTPACRP